MTEPIELETARLRLRQWRDEDREPFAAMGADPRVMEFFISVIDRAASDKLVDTLSSRIVESGYGFWAAEKKDGGEFIGFAGIQVPRVAFPFSPCVEIGWRLAFKHWGEGYATEAARASLAVGFERLDLDEIVSIATLANRRSRHVMEKLSMREDAATFEHPSVPVGHPIREHCLYRLARKDWVAQQIRSQKNRDMPS